MPPQYSFFHLPQPAKCAIEYLDAQGYGNRSIAKLDAYLNHYYRVYGERCDDRTRDECHQLAIRRFSLENEDALVYVKTTMPYSLLKDVIRYKDAVAMVDSTSTYPRFVIWGRGNDGRRLFPLPQKAIS